MEEEPLKFDITFLNYFRIQKDTLRDLGIEIRIENNSYLLTKEEYLLIKIASGEDLLNLRGNWDFQTTDIRSLPDNLSIEGYLDLRDTKITKLPKNLYVGRDLRIRRTMITELPKCLIVKGSIFTDVGQITKRNNEHKLNVLTPSLPI